MSFLNFNIKKNLSKIGKIFFFGNLILAFLFSFFYLFAELLVYNNPDLSKKYGMGTVDKVYPYHYYLHYAISNQTTVGQYSVFTGRGVNHENLLFRILNISQMISVLLIWGICLTAN